MLTDQLERIRFGGDEAVVRRLSVRGLLPDTEHYMTYEGSTTSPACPETVTWIVQNKPIYITKQQVSCCMDVYVYRMISQNIKLQQLTTINSNLLLDHLCF